MSVGDVAKRILLGQKLRSSQLGETLLPKRIALPVFASDALSSVAYAPDEIFIMLSLAGASAYVWSWKIGIAVALVMAVVVASYRQNVHAYPSGGGDYEVATVNLGPTAGTTVASALLVDYVLTVAVSISSGAQYAASAVGALSGHEATFATVLVILLAAMNLRGIRESGTFFAIPTYAFMVAILGMCAYGMLQLVSGNLPDVESAHLDIAPAPGFDDSMTTMALLFLLARAFSSGCAALTGVEAISNGVPAFRRPKSKNAATTLLMLGAIAITMMLSVIALANAMGLKYVDPHDLDRLTHRRPAAARRLRPAHRDRADRPSGVHRLLARLLLRRHRHRRHPGAGGQHGVQRLPGPRLDPGPGRLCAAGPRLARRPAGLQQRHRLPGADGDHPDPGLRRRGHPTDPALHRGRLRLVHPQPARHDPALDPQPPRPRRTPACAGT